MKKLILSISIICLTLTATSCRETTQEKTQDALESMGEDIEHNTEEALDKAGDAIEHAGKEINEEIEGTDDVNGEDDAN